MTDINMDEYNLKYSMGDLMETGVRKLLINEKLATVEEVALMNRSKICKRLLEHYKVVSCDIDKNIFIIVKHSDVNTYKSIAKVLDNFD